MSVSADARWIPEYRGSYKLTPDGRVFTFKHAFPKELARHVQQDGLVQAILWKHGKRTHFSVAELVLAVFGPSRKPFQVPIYRDGDPGNCHIANLRWGVPEDRVVAPSPLSDADVKRIFKSRRSAAVLAEEYGVVVRTIERIKSGDRRTKATRRLRQAVKAKRKKKVA